MLDTVFKFLGSLLMIPEVQGVIIGIIMALIAWMINKWTWARNVISLAIGAYEYAEEQGLVQNLKGYEKFDPFMDKFSTEFKDKYGRDPTPKDKAKAVEAMEKAVKKTQ